jgi:phosphoribosylformylglycinamidine (FGAM) synthase-like enzyme
VRPAGPRRDTVLFSESPSRVVVSARGEDVTALLRMAAEAGVPAEVIGRTGGRRLSFSVDGETLVNCDVQDAEQRWRTALEQHFQRKAS